MSKSLVTVLTLKMPLTQVHGSRVAKEVISSYKPHTTLLTHKRLLVPVSTPGHQMDILYMFHQELVWQENLATLLARMLVCATVALTGALAQGSTPS